MIMAKLAKLRNIVEIDRMTRNKTFVNLDEDVRKGVVARSVWFEYPGFNPIFGVKFDHQHTCALGNNRQLTMNLYKTETYLDIPHRRVLPTIFNELIMQQPKPSQLGWRTRRMDYSNYKAAEWRDLYCFFFPLLLKDQIYEESNDLILHRAFNYKAFLLPPNEYQRVPKVDIKILNETYLDMYQARFGEKFMVYNPHIEYHLPEIREENGDLTSI